MMATTRSIIIVLSIPHFRVRLVSVIAPILNVLPKTQSCAAVWETTSIIIFFNQMTRMDQSGMGVIAMSVS
jgi:hypothetical protein